MTDLRTQVADLLRDHWDGQRGWCVPNPATYPHLWLWDSCFHAIIWAHLGDQRAVRELAAVLTGPTPGGMVPHMRYGGQPPDTWLGPSHEASAITQPPIYAHAARVLDSLGFEIPDPVLAGARAGLDWLWQHRRTPDGLLVVVHPWETGNDHSPRFDDWANPGHRHRHNRATRTRWNKELMFDVVLDDHGAATGSRSFAVATAGFNAYCAHAMSELAALTGDTELGVRGDALATAIDTLLWDEDEGLWSDRAVVGGGEPLGGDEDLWINPVVDPPADSVRIPISDGVMPALVTADAGKARRALAQLTDPDRFGAPFGPANVARTHPAYDPDTYWRGPAWPPLSYLFTLALRRWGLDRQAEEIAEATLAAVERNGWAEYWNPETGAGHGAAPQTWSGLALAMSAAGS